ncbi:four helix bundle protein [Dyella solisilvae]|uniref:Four helix bundle protein n=1 Tax=Dyella solisilvae TaxID=1920168 RepID=A0A370K3I5_9GAMM|nr:four helix bundle protein [Dyella solisilvae]RDI97202.1 four helix bundle protein [Dyella solisilvae]
MHYRDTVVWGKAMEMACEIYRLAKLIPDEERYGLRSQITRAAVSVPSNIAEGWTRESKKEKSQFLSIAHGSLAELETQLTLCERVGWLALSQTACVRQQVEEVSRILTTMRRNQRAR